MREDGGEFADLDFGLRNSGRKDDPLKSHEPHEISEAFTKERCLIRVAPGDPAPP